MAKQAKAEQLMAQLSIAYSDSVVKRLPILRDYLLKAAGELNRSGDAALVASKLYQKLALYQSVHKQAMPPAIVLLQQQLKKQALKYDATAIIATLFPFWL